jgi:hypothetical protein
MLILIGVTFYQKGIIKVSTDIYKLLIKNIYTRQCRTYATDQTCLVNAGRKTSRKISLRRARRRREGNIKIDLREMGRCGQDSSTSGERSVADS